MASATDIITYIGVPLAVLGVLPILYTFALAILTKTRIRSALIHHGHKPTTSSRPHDGFSIRSSPMSSLLEIELPRYTIAPLDRHSEEYWKIRDAGYMTSNDKRQLLSRAESTLSMIEEGKVQGFLKGGSWRTFNWRRLVVGRKLHRIQYEDELREPPAEIDFSELVNFLLDWGAIPDSVGWEKLRSGGLWTPAGTILLRKPIDGGVDVKRISDWVLRTSVPDDSDGVLTLSVRWRQDYDEEGPERSVASMAPGWGRISEPKLSPDSSSEDSDTATKTMQLSIKNAKSENKHCQGVDGFRFRVEDNRITKLFWEQDLVETGAMSMIFDSHDQVFASQWFSSALASLLTLHDQQAALWGFEMTENITTFALRSSVPCGVMVILDLLDAKDAPEWSSEIGKVFNGFNSVSINNPASEFHNRTMARIAAEKMEATMPPDQARVHKSNRQAAERRAMSDEMTRNHYAKLEQEERRIKEAIASPRMTHKSVADACLAWLKTREIVEQDWTVEKVCQAAVYLLVVDQSTDGPCAHILKIMREWFDWSHAGGMKRNQIDLLRSKKTEFCYVACLVAVVGEAAALPKKAGADLVECVKAWKKVRIG